MNSLLPLLFTALSVGIRSRFPQGRKPRPAPRNRRSPKFFLERLEDRITPTVSVFDLPQYDPITLPVGGGDDTTGIARLDSYYATTDAFEEIFEIRQVESPHTLVAAISLADLRTAHGLPGATSGGPDGMTSVTAFAGSWYVIATSPFSTDAIFKIAADGSSSELFASAEIHNRGDLPFNRSEIEFFSSDRAFLAHSSGLSELDGNGQIVRTLSTGNFDGVAVVDHALFAVRRDGVLVADMDLTDEDSSVTEVLDVNQTLADLSYGSFGTLGEALFVVTEQGEVAYWRREDLFAGQLGEPTPLFDIPGFLGKIHLADRDLYASLNENALRVRESIDFQLEVVETEVSVTEGSGPLPAIRLHLTGPPNRPIKVDVAPLSGDSDIQVVDNQVEFDANNWRADQYIKLQAADDADSDDGSATLRLTAPGLMPLDVTVREHDQDRPLGIEIRQSELAVREGRTATFQVRLSARPNAPITLTTGRSSGDTDLEVDAHAEVVIDPDDWDRWRWVSVRAAEDVDTLDGSATLSVSAAGLVAREIIVTEVDAGPAGTPVTYEVIVDDYLPLPLQGETQEFSFFNRLRGDRGKIDPSGEVVIGRGYSEARVTAANGFAGLFHSLNHPLAEGLTLDFGAILPSQIRPEFQYRATEIIVQIEDGQGTFRIELKDPDNNLLFLHDVNLNGGERLLRVPLSNPPANVQSLNWIIIGNPDDFVRVKQVGLEVEGNRIGYREAFVWPYATLLSNFNPRTGLTRDRASFPDGDFDGVNTSGFQAAAAAVAAELGVISHEDASVIVQATAGALLDLQANASHNGVLPHFTRTNVVHDNEQPGFTVEAGSWTPDNAIRGFYGQDYLRSDPGDGTGGVRWSFDIVRAGEYEVFARWVESNNHASDAPYTIHHAGGSTTVRVNQRTQGDEWVSLGRFAFEPGSNSVTLSDDANGVIIADAIRLEGPPHIIPDTEFATIDTVIGLFGVLLGAEALGLPTQEIEEAFRAIDWEAATLENGIISHGYSDDGALLLSGWDFFGGESLMVALAHAAATGDLPAIPNIDPGNLQTFNGSGFIDEILHLFVDIRVDAYGANWTAYRPEAARRQVEYYDTQPAPVFGASAVEAPIPSQIEVAAGREVANPYLVNGIGGANPGGDGSDRFIAPVAAPHYAGLIWSLEPEAAERLWDYLQQEGIATPLNMVESLVVQQWGNVLETYWHDLKGSLNLGFTVLGTARHFLEDNPLFEAARSNAFLNAGLQLVEPPLAVLTESSSSTAVTEGGVADDYSIVLTRQPAAEVTIQVAVNNNQITTSTQELTFTPETWDTPQSVSVIAVDDHLVEGPHTATISHTITSTDPVYDALPLSPVMVSITDNDRFDIAGRAFGDWWVAVSTGTNFTNQLSGHWSNAVQWVDVQVADVNGDGLDDIVGRTSGAWWVALSTGSGFVNQLWGQWSNAVQWVDVQVADVNGDGLDDLVGRTGGDWWVALSTGNSFTNALWGHWSNAVQWVDVQVADVNGDGLDDLVGRTDGAWWVALSTGSGFVNQLWGQWSNAVQWVDVQVADVNGDGLDDLVGRTGGDWWVALSTGSSFSNQLWGQWSNAVQWVDVQVADINGDGLGDIVGRTSGAWWVARSTSSAFDNQLWGQWSNAVQWVDVQVADVNGDGLGDIVGRTSGAWWVARSTGSSFTNALWGQWSNAVPWVDVLVGNFFDASAQNLETRSVATDSGSVQKLTHAELAPLVVEAIDILTATGLRENQVQQLQQVQFQIDNLPNNIVGQALGNTITLDNDAASVGYFVDLTPGADEEFDPMKSTQQGSPGGDSAAVDALFHDLHGEELLALEDSPAAGRIDLLTVILHELAHILGREHEAEGLLAETLAAGVRYR